MYRNQTIRTIRFTFIMTTRPIIISMAVAAMLASCGGERQPEQQSLEEISKQELATALQERDELLALVKEVSTSLQQIKQLENIMTVAAAHPAENAGQRAQILSDIACLKKKVQQRKEKLQQLETRLRDSTINNKELTETIEALRIQIDSQIEEIDGLRQQLIAANEKIDMLNGEVDSLNTTITAVSGELDVAQDASLRLANELNTCYYVIATKSDLKKHNIIESGFLRKTKLMKGDFDKGYFVISDKRVLDTLALGTPKARILTTHPEASYELLQENGSAVIRIKDPDKFWSLTNYLVIQKD